MLNELKADLDTIIELVGKVPTPLQEVAFKLILERWFDANITPRQEPPPTVGKSNAPSGIPDAIKPFLTANAITTEILGKAFHPLGSGVQLLASTISGNGKASKLINLSLLLCVKQALESGSFTCTLKELRELAIHYDCYDSPNFSTTLRKHKSYYKPREKSADLELSGPGLKKAGEIIKNVAAGE